MANDAIGRRYALLNKQLQQTEGRQLQQEQDALSRRFAAIGGLGSGASIKADQMASQESSRRLSQGKQALGVAEADERFKQEEIEKGRAFQTSERLGSQDFAAGQAGLQRQFQTGERLGSQDFAAGQAGLQRQFQTSERLGGQQFASDEAKQQRGFITSERLGGQQFASSEAMKGREFSAAEAQKQRTFATGERLGTQDWQGQQNLLTRDLQKRIADNQLSEAIASRLQQGRQFDSQLRETRESRIAQNQLARDELIQNRTLAERAQNLQQRIADDRLAFDRANQLWQEGVFNKEWPINQRIAMENLEVQRQAVENGNQGILASIFNGLF